MTTRTKTKADIQREADHWRQRFYELQSKYDEKVEELNDQIWSDQRRNQDLETQIYEIRSTWNEWIEADKGTSSSLAFAKWEPETFAKLLRLLPPHSTEY